MLQCASSMHLSFPVPFSQDGRPHVPRLEQFYIAQTRPAPIKLLCGVGLLIARSQAYPGFLLDLTAENYHACKSVFSYYCMMFAYDGNDVIAVKAPAKTSCLG